VTPGIYRHYKGHYYLGLFTARNSEHRDDEVAVYFSLEKWTLWVRPLKRPLIEGDDCWNDIIYWPDGWRRQRFVYSVFNYVFFALAVLVLAAGYLLGSHRFH
jgi:hypothetical protein